MVRKPERPRITFCSHHRQGISLSACLKNTDRFQKKLAIRIDFVRVCQNKRNRSRSGLFLLFFCVGGRARRGAVVNDSLNGCQSRGTALPAGKGVLPPKKRACATKSCVIVGCIFSILMIEYSHKAMKKIC